MAVRILSALMLFIGGSRALRVPGLFYAEDSPVNAKLVERISTASSLGRNESRGLEGLSRRERKVIGPKVDILFKVGHYEVKCCEVGKEDVLPYDNKYLDDGMLKLPKTLRDMFSRLVKVNLVKANSMYAVGFLMMGLEPEVLIMDTPSGSIITRISRTKKNFHSQIRVHVLVDK